jgi:hypothetical protein
VSDQINVTGTHRVERNDSPRLRSDGGSGADDATPTDEEVVQAAAEAAEGVVLDRYKQSELTDLDVTVTFEDGVLDVDVYLNPPDAESGEPGRDVPDPDEVVDEAVQAATAAVDELFDVADDTDGA